MSSLINSSATSNEDIGKTECGKNSGVFTTMDAFEISKIKNFKSLGLTLECMTAYDDLLLVCIRGGQLFLYEKRYEHLPNKKPYQSSVSMSLKKSSKNFSNSPVSQMKAIPELSCLLVQYGDKLNVHDLDTFQFKSALESTSGLSYFDVYVKEKVDEKKKVQLTISAKLAVAVGKKLRILKWNGQTFEDDMIDRSNFSKVAKCLLWCEDVLFIGYKNEYFLLKPETNEIHDMFTFGGHQKEPLMIRVAPDVVLLLQETKCVFVDSCGKPAKKFTISWSGVPQFIAHSPPYIIAVLSGYIEIKTLDPCVSVQQIDLKRVKSICQGSDTIHLEALHTVHTLSMLSVNDRIRGMLHSKHFELAIQILIQCEISPDQRDKELSSIEAQQAVHLFCTHKYEDAFTLFIKLNTDPSHVVGLFPQEHIPKDFRLPFEYPEKLPSLQGSELKSAIVDLVFYLKEKRKLIGRDIDIAFSPILDHGRNVTLQTKEKALQLIDTMLLRCYIQTKNDGHLNDLINAPDNRVIVKDAVGELKGAGRYREMINLFKMHQMHETALTKLKITKGSNKKGNISSRTDAAISYLQDLGKEHLQFILKNASWILEHAPKDGIKIFTAESAKVHEWPPTIVQSFLEKINADLAIDYLEHVIYEWQDDSQELHYCLSQLLRAKIAKLQAKHGSSETLAKNETGPLGVYRRRLIKFLKTSKHYKADDILPTFPMDGFFEERALLLGSMARHDAALGIYLYVLGEHDQAEDYCFDHYSPKDELNRHVFLTLVQVYFCPPKAREIGLSEYKVEPKPDKMRALCVLQTYSSKIDLLEALKILPEDLTIKSTRMFLEVAMETMASRKHMNQVHRTLLQYDNTEVTKEKIALDKESLLIDVNTVCDHCEKKIGKSIFARTFDEKILHHHCYRELTGHNHHGN